MIYTFVGELSLIDKEIEEIISKETNSSIIKYDLNETSILKVLEDINTISLFDEKKIIICTNYSKIDNADALINYLDNKNDNILIFKEQEFDIKEETKDEEEKSNEKEKRENKKKILKALKDKTNYIELKNIDLSSYIKESLHGYEITNLNISLLKDYCNNDFNRIKKEIDKLKMYKLEDKNITSEDIKKIVKKGLDKTIFDLFDAINKKNMNKIFEVYYELINSNEEEIKLISILSNNFKLIYKTKELLKNNKDEECIKLLGLKNPYRFKFLKEQSYMYTEQELLKNIKGLSDLDINIKSGVIDKSLGLELFLSNL